MYEFIWIYLECINQELNSSQKAVELGIQELINWVRVVRVAILTIRKKKKKSFNPSRCFI